MLERGLVRAEVGLQDRELAERAALPGEVADLPVEPDCLVERLPRLVELAEPVVQLAEVQMVRRATVHVVDLVVVPQGPVKVLPGLRQLPAHERDVPEVLEVEALAAYRSEPAVDRQRLQVVGRRQVEIAALEVHET